MEMIRVIVGVPEASARSVSSVPVGGGRAAGAEDTITGAGAYDDTYRSLTKRGGASELRYTPSGFDFKAHFSVSGFVLKKLVRMTCTMLNDPCTSLLDMSRLAASPAHWGQVVRFQVF